MTTTPTPIDPHDGLTCEEVENYAQLRDRQLTEARQQLKQQQAAADRAAGTRPEGPEQLREAIAAVARVEAIIAGRDDEVDALAPHTIAAASVHVGTYVRMLAAVETEHLTGMLAETRTDLVAALERTETGDQR